MEAKATRQATHVIPAYRKESLFFLQKNGQRPSTNYASSLNGFKMGWMEVAGTVYPPPPIFGLKHPVVKARVPTQKRHDGKAVSHRSCAHRAQKSR